MTLFRRTRRLLMAVAVLAFAACGDANGGEPVDVEGEWEMTSTVASDNCDERRSQTFPMMITQEGNAVTAKTPELTFEGTIHGNQMKLNGSFSEDDGTVTVNAALTVSADGESMEGSDTWIWTEDDGVDTCSGSDLLSGTRIS